MASVSTIGFIPTALITLFLFLRALPQKPTVAIILLSWISLISILAIDGFFNHTDKNPPRIFVAFAPGMLVIITLFFSVKGRTFMDGVDIRAATLLSIIRIPVELVLYALFLNHLIPVIMTFEGRNLDVFAGLTAPFIYLFCFKGQNIIRSGLLLAWNILSLILLLNIIVLALFSMPYPFQKFGFEQPNRGLLQFPFIWLPCFIVPSVMFCHLASIRKLLKPRD